MSKLHRILAAIGLVFAAPTIARATDVPPAKELSAFEKSLQMHENVSTKETIVQNGQRKFRRIEINSEIFYLQLQADLSSNADLVMLCGENPAQFGPSSPALITAAVRTTKRTRFFVEGLRMMCLGDGNKTRIGVSPEIAIGFILDDDPDPNSILKNRRISINPVSISPMVNFNAEW